MTVSGFLREVRLSVRPLWLVTRLSTFHRQVTWLFFKQVTSSRCCRRQDYPREQRRHPLLPVGDSLSEQSPGCWRGEESRGYGFLPVRKALFSRAALRISRIASRWELPASLPSLLKGASGHSQLSVLNDGMGIVLSW